MSYVDGFVVPVKTVDKQAYIDHAKEMAEIFKEYGVLKIVETWGDDVPEGEVTSFPMSVKCQEDETVVFSWALWPSKEARDKAWADMMEDPRMQPGATPMPFDGKRMIYGGFETIVDA